MTYQVPAPTRRSRRRVAAACLAMSLLMLLPGSLIPAQANDGDGVVDVRADFRLVVKRLGFKAKRDVGVAVDLSGEAGQVEITFNKPVKRTLGVKHIAFNVQLQELDSHKTIETVTVDIPDGAMDVNFPVRFPGPGNYALYLSQDDVMMKPAKVKILPDTFVRVPIAVGESIAAQPQPTTTEATGL